MIFSIRNLGFELGSLLLEGWAAFAARVVCAALLLVLGWLARQLLSRRVCPALLRRSWRLAGTPILLRSFAVPLQRLTLAGGRGLYRQWGIAPRPETNFLTKSIARYCGAVKPPF